MHDATPEWRALADELEAQDRLAEAEEVIQQAVPHLGAYASIAEMYARRMRRLQRQGDRARARAAFEQAERWIAAYAGSATSGGEGLALSHERDQFLKQLRSELSV